MTRITGPASPFSFSQAFQHVVLGARTQILPDISSWRAIAFQQEFPQGQPVGAVNETVVIFPKDPTVAHQFFIGQTSTPVVPDSETTYSHFVAAPVVSRVVRPKPAFGSVLQQPRPVHAAIVPLRPYRPVAPGKTVSVAGALLVAVDYSEAGGLVFAGVQDRLPGALEQGVKFTSRELNGQDLATLIAGAQFFAAPKPDVKEFLSFDAKSHYIEIKYQAGEDGTYDGDKARLVIKGPNGFITPVAVELFDPVTNRTRQFKVTHDKGDLLWSLDVDDLQELRAGNVDPKNLSATLPGAQLKFVYSMHDDESGANSVGVVWNGFGQFVKNNSPTSDSKNISRSLHDVW